MKHYLRRIPLHHGVNVRDLGGYAIGDHQMSAWNRLLRSDDPYQFDQHDYEILKEYKVDRILDLRSLAEQKMSICKCEEYGIRHVSLPFMKEEKSKFDFHDQEAMQKFLNSMKLDYVTMLNENTSIVSNMLDEIADSLKRGNSVLFHCTAGKDRTGILACILLDLIGVAKDDILSDYQVSATYNREGVNKRVGKAIEDPRVAHLFTSDIETLQPLLDLLHETSCEEWLFAHGVKQETITMIQKEMIENS